MSDREKANNQLAIEGTALEIAELISNSENARKALLDLATRNVQIVAAKVYEVLTKGSYLDWRLSFILNRYFGATEEELSSREISFFAKIDKVFVAAKKEYGIPNITRKNLFRCGTIRNIFAHDYYGEHISGKVLMQEQVFTPSETIRIDDKLELPVDVDTLHGAFIKEFTLADAEIGKVLDGLKETEK